MRDRVTWRSMTHRHEPPARLRAFTLVELMVTVAVVGIAAGLGMFAMTEVLSSAT